MHQKYGTTGLIASGDFKRIYGSGFVPGRRGVSNFVLVFTLTSADGIFLAVFVKGETEIGAFKTSRIVQQIEASNFGIIQRDGMAVPAHISVDKHICITGKKNIVCGNYRECRSSPANQMFVNKMLQKVQFGAEKFYGHAAKRFYVLNFVVEDMRMRTSKDDIRVAVQAAKFEQLGGSQLGFNCCTNGLNQKQRQYYRREGQIETNLK